MNSRKYHKLKRHPLVRFIRGIFRLLRVLFKPTKSSHRHNLVSADRSEDLNNPATHSFDRDRLMTVGELLDRVKWQSPQVNIQPEISSSHHPQTSDAARN